MALAAMRVELALSIRAVKAGDANRLLPAMLQGVQAQRHHGRSLFGADDAENAAFFPELVAINIPRGAVAEIELGGDVEAGGFTGGEKGCCHGGGRAFLTGGPEWRPEGRVPTAESRAGLARTVASVTMAFLMRSP